ncbi:alpha/beta-hydrolase [Hymenopellis radicata]|nr:alpha/beta-hydrolase [Hymenopellis radicata]
MSMCADCFSVVVHEGTPTGKLEVIGGVECYTATPEGDYARDKVLLYLTDVFGMALVITRQGISLLVDSFAKNGFRVRFYCLMDYLNGDPVPVDYSKKEGFDISVWKGRHGREATRPPLDKVIAALKEEGVKDFGATGYCLGGRYVFDLAFDGVIKVGTTAHPSLLTFPDDFEKYVSTASVPLQINSCEVDAQFPLEIHAKVDEVFAKFAPGYERLYFEGCTHGPKVKAAKEGAFNASVQWLKKYL